MPAGRNESIAPVLNYRTRNKRQPKPPEILMRATKTGYSLSWQVAGKDVWAITSTSAGVLAHAVFRKANQSYADVIARLNKSNLGWFLQQHVPREVLMTMEPAGSWPLAGMGARTRNGGRTP